MWKHGEKTLINTFLWEQITVQNSLSDQVSEKQNFSAKGYKKSYKVFLFILFGYFTFYQYNYKCYQYNFFGYFTFYQ